MSMTDGFSVKDRNNRSTTKESSILLKLFFFLQRIFHFMIGNKSCVNCIALKKSTNILKTRIDTLELRIKCLSEEVQNLKNSVKTQSIQSLPETISQSCIPPPPPPPPLPSSLLQLSSTSRSSKPHFAQKKVRITDLCFLNAFSKVFTQHSVNWVQQIVTIAKK